MARAKIKFFFSSSQLKQELERGFDRRPRHQHKGVLLARRIVRSSHFESDNTWTPAAPADSVTIQLASSRTSSSSSLSWLMIVFCIYRSRAAFSSREMGKEKRKRRPPWAIQRSVYSRSLTFQTRHRHIHHYTVVVVVVRAPLPRYGEMERERARDDDARFNQQFVLILCSVSLSSSSSSSPPLLLVLFLLFLSQFSARPRLYLSCRATAAIVVVSLSPATFFSSSSLSLFSTTRPNTRANTTDGSSLPPPAGLALALALVSIKTKRYLWQNKHRSSNGILIHHRATAVT